ncbi:MAG: serine hydrolase [Capsulimonadaceae bacterium]|nr:serine hydrolase [Capsulimonadaceae bacterium]
MPGTKSIGAKPAPFASRLQPFVDSGVLAGAIAAVANRDGFIAIEVVGLADIAAGRPMAQNSLFWIASQSKPFTTTAFMTLVDEGKVSVEDPLEKYLPEFANLRYVAYEDADAALLKPVKTPILVRHVLSHTSGLPFSSKLERPTLDLRPLRDRVISYTIAPLLFEPGTKYSYSNEGTNTVGRLIEVLSGQDYEQFLKERIITPLGLRDTTFYPNAEQLGRLAKAYKPDPETGALTEQPIDQLLYPLTDPSRQPMPAGGLFSTARDVSIFYRMLLNGGIYDGKRIVSEESLNQATSKQTGESVDANYGFGFAADDGSFGHGGAIGTNTSVDRKSKTFTIWMVQHHGYKDDAGGAINAAFREGVEEVLANAE